MSPWIPLLSAAFIIGMLGEVAKKLVNAKPGDKGLKGVYIVTYKAHALFVGALLGLALFGLKGPVPEVFGVECGGYVLAYATAGGIAMVGYASIVGVIKSAIENFRARD